MCIAAIEQRLMDQVHEVWVITLPGMLKFLSLITVHHLILIITKMILQFLGEGPTHEINGSIGAADKKYSINFSKAKTKFSLNLHYNGDNDYLFVNRYKYIILNQIIEM